MSYICIINYYIELLIDYAIVITFLKAVLLGKDYQIGVLTLCDPKLQRKK